MRHCIMLQIKQEYTNQKYENQGDGFSFNLFHARKKQSQSTKSFAITMASANNRLLKNHHKHFQSNCFYLENETFGHSTLSTFKYYSCLLEMHPLLESECSTQPRTPLRAFPTDESLHCHTPAHFIFQHPQSSSKGLKKASMLLI